MLSTSRPSPLDDPAIRARIAQVVRYVCRLSRRPDLTADALHDAYVVCLESFPRYRPDRASVRTYLSHLARWSAMRTCGQTGQEVRVPKDAWIDALEEPPDPAVGCDVALELAERDAKLHIAMSALTARAQEVLWRHAKGDSTRDIAKDLGITRGGVRTLRERAFVRLRRRLGAQQSGR